MLVSIIIVTYNSSKVLKDCLDSILKNKTNLDLEVILVDNNSNAPNERQQFLRFLEKEYSALKLQLIQLPENRGFGTANNQGAKHAKGEYLLILNADTIIENRVMRLMIEFLENNPRAGAVGPKLLTQERKTQWWACGYKTGLLRVIGYNFGLLPFKLWRSQAPAQTDWISGAALMIRKDIFERVNGFDENFFMYFEDEDLCWRIKDLKYDIYYLGNLTITHLGGQSFKQSETKSLQKKFFYESMVYFYKKHYGPLRALTIRIITSIIIKVKRHPL